MTPQQQFEAQLGTLIDKLTLLSKAQLEAQLKGYKAAEVHTIQYIGDHPTANVTQIAKAQYVTRGAVSKMTQRLMKRDLIQRYQKPDNKKALYFRLTSAGEKVYQIHAQLSRGFQQRDQSVFENVAPAEIQATLAFLEHYNQHLTQEITKRGLEK